MVRGGAGAVRGGGPREVPAGDPGAGPEVPASRPGTAPRAASLEGRKVRKVPPQTDPAAPAAPPGVAPGVPARRAGGGVGCESGAPADPQAVARAICLRLLTMSPRTRAQLAEALRKREVPDDAAEAVLERFSEVGLIDDEAFAAAWVSSRHAGRGLARRALASELRQRGVEEDTVKEAVEQLDPEQEVETARRLVARKLLHPGAGARGEDAEARRHARPQGLRSRPGLPGDS
nr:hypothetical protein GCM10020093_104540 [Planobispora longispora]